MVSQKDIESFLHFGYYLDYENPYYSIDISNINKDIYNNLSLEELIKIGKENLMKSIDRLFTPNHKHVVPISGGLDSRTILAALLEFTEASNISTYTFGTPGTLDYEIGTNLARSLGTNHISFPLTEYTYSIDELFDISKRLDYQTVLFHHPPIWRIDELFQGFKFWSGFLGDRLTGSHYNKNFPKEVDKAKKLFIKMYRYQSNINLTNKKDDYFFDNLQFKKTGLSTFESLDFINRQLKFIAPHVLIRGYDYRLPFLDKDLINFFLSIPNEYRENQLLYKKMLLSTFPKLFEYPVKNNHGLKLTSSKISIFLSRVSNRLKRTIFGINKNINYLDFDIKIREKEDLKKIVYDSINDLYNRRLINWLDIRKLFKDHIDKKGNYGNALILLTSLEIHMKVKEISKKKE